jgi:uncharacterized protein
VGLGRRARGASNLAAALGRMRLRVRPGSYALVFLPRSRARLGVGIAARDGSGAFAQVVAEREGVTLLLPERELPGLKAGLGGCRVRRGFRVISFETPMEWTVVGFLARVTGALAEAGVPVGVVCAFDFDHVFVPAGRLAAARRAIARALRPRGSRSRTVDARPGRP